MGDELGMEKDERLEQIEKIMWMLNGDNEMVDLGLIWATEFIKYDIEWHDLSRMMRRAWMSYKLGEFTAEILKEKGAL
jgi:hypothetical protein